MSIIIVAEDDFIMSEYSESWQRKGIRSLLWRMQTTLSRCLTIGMTFGCSLPILECLDRLTA
jgi:hypothetical protein